MYPKINKWRVFYSEMRVFHGATVSVESIRRSANALHSAIIEHAKHPKIEPSNVRDALTCSPINSDRQIIRVVRFAFFRQHQIGSIVSRRRHVDNIFIVGKSYHSGFRIKKCLVAYMTACVWISPGTAEFE